MRRAARLYTVVIHDADVSKSFRFRCLAYKWARRHRGMDWTLYRGDPAHHNIIDMNIELPEEVFTYREVPPCGK